ncbi:phage tail tape measure protein [Paenibacillus azoreducens]|uniref:phage tail tape measure protein n=1 Tax=Paenibacillus azoreducens TaxID=116718 RepID=UPI0039F5422E
MATNTTQLMMIDQFSAPLRRVDNQVQTTIVSLERMRLLVERPLRDVQIRLDPSQVLRDVSHLGSRISAQIVRIEADVQLNVNAQLSGAMGSPDTSMERLRTEIENLTQAIQNGGGGPDGGGPGGNGPGGGPGGGGSGFIGELGKFGKKLLVDAAETAIKGASQLQQLQGGLQAQVGIDEGQAAALMQGVKDIYAAGWGESLQAVSNNAATVRQNLGGLSEEASAAFTKSAYAVEQVAKGETNIGELSKVTRTLMANFQGLNETQALDLITTGFQRGGNYAGDMLDTVNNYAAHFASLGMSAEQMFATLIAGSGQGALNLDKVGEAVKESSTKLQDLSDSSKESLGALGLNANETAAKIAAGGETANQAYQAVLLSLGKMDNGIERNKIGVDLFGSMWEELGDSAILAMQAGEDGLGNFGGATAEAAEALQNNLGFQLEQFKRSFALGFADAGQGSIEAITPLIMMLNEAFQSGRFQPFFDSFAMGLSFAAQMVAFLIENALWLSDVIMNNWSWIEPIIWGVVAALGSLLLLTQLVSVAQAILNAVMDANPFVLIAAVVIGLIAAFIALWNTNDAFAAAMYRTWNGILNFFDQIPIFFTWIGYGISNAFDMARVESLKIVDALANGVIDKINWLIDKLNKLPGVSIQALKHLNTSASAATEAEALRQSRAADLNSMRQDAAQRAAEREGKVQNFIKERQDKRTKKEAEAAAQRKPQTPFDNSSAVKTAKGATIPTGASKPILPNAKGAPVPNGASNPKPMISTAGVDGKDIKTVGKVGQVDKINGKVDISSEDLKMMRELAELNNIQNFVTLKPSINFGDTHIRQESDINTIIAHITEKLEQDIASSVDAVYG